MRTLFLALATFVAAPAFAAVNLADTADLAKYSPNSMPDGKLIDGIKNRPELLKGAAYKFGLHIVGPSAATDKGTVYPAAAMLTDDTGALFYRKFNVTVGGQPRRALSVNVLEDIPLSEMHFTVNTGLLDRMVLVQDAAHGVSLLFPLGVGGVDEAVMGEAYRLLTPKFKNATITRSTVIPARDEPAYYRGRPFMPISTARGTRTAIAFHITILGDDTAEKYGLNYLVRGFESHGCMRMREKDLLEFFTIVMNGAEEKLPVNVDNHVPNVDVAHPYPFNKSSYMRVTYFEEPPHYKRDDIPGEHLVIMDRAQGQPDLDRFNDVLNPVSDFTSGESDLDLINSKFEMP